MPIFPILFFIFTIYNAGVPTNLNFSRTGGEFLNLTTVFQISPLISALGATSILFSAIYFI
jgi:NADH:ubiquinone oxidoreductase subunit 4 (subunit M)